MTIASPVQKKLAISDPAPPVLATISDARILLRGHDEDDILGLIDEGYLLAWNIALAPSQMARELRLLPPSIELYARAGHKTLRVAHSVSRKSKFENPFTATWPRLVLDRHFDKPFLFATTIKLILNCGATHITNLVDAGALKCLPLNGQCGTHYRRGPNGAACVTRESFLAFLKSRLEGGQ